MNYAVIFAGGVGSRMADAEIPKQFLEVCGKPILIHTILNFERCPEIDGVSVACVEGWIGPLRQMLAADGIRKVRWIVPGGRTGQQSICSALKAVHDASAAPEDDIVLIHDGVRPFVEQRIISENIACVKRYGSSVTVCPVPETIVELDGDGAIRHIPQRSACYLSKAPQGFRLHELMAAHERAAAEGRFDCTNSAELMHRYGHSLHIVHDTDRNIKVTTPTDLLLIEDILKAAGQGGEAT